VLCGRILASDFVHATDIRVQRRIQWPVTSKKDRPFMITVRPARPEDAAFIAAGNVHMAIETEGRAPDRELVLRGVTAVFEDPAKGRFFVAEHDGTAVGQVLVQREWSDWRNAWFWWLASVHVLPEHRGRGIFRRLYEHLQALAHADPDVCGIRLYVEDHNARAQAVYGRLGMSDGHYRVYEEDFRPPPAA
jgi:ribosomal protein S18 acetylase RimI-like enzyme